ncbi:transglycosylase SLT domain-containing protein [Rhodobacteraceae bacterium KMM 6894]|nr:transglycosylase SLT domain-containing protein [Rhodobacteraceae bacterium KMM 6894]
MLPLLLVGAGKTVASAADVCDDAALRAAQVSNVPISVLLAITRVETGRTRSGLIKPWPWTVNMEGVGKWFKSRSEARSYVDQHFENGARSFDVGCFQLNYRWHGGHFSSIDNMFDPFTNAGYAAEFISKLYDETGDWSAAAAAYHSRTPKNAARYLDRFTRVHNQITTIHNTKNNLSKPIPTPYPSLKSKYPLFKSSGTNGQYGSLVPIDDIALPAFVTFAVRSPIK